MLPFILSSSIITLTSLDFLGFGMPIESPSLGELLAQGKNNINAYWLGISGFFIITFISILLVFIGEAARDSFKNHFGIVASQKLTKKPSYFSYTEVQYQLPSLINNITKFFLEKNYKK